ncbi:MAG: hypothetical protein MJ094_04730 [Saccharofermentans sp.]|nr:hypothetical protein [Saccharofermentans sp.]
MSKKLNNENLLRAFSDVDDKYIEEALNYSLKGKKANVSTLQNRALIGSIAAVAIAVVGGIIFLNISNKSSEAEYNASAHNAAVQEEVSEMNTLEIEAAVCEDEIDGVGGAPATENETSVATMDASLDLDMYMPEELGNIVTSDYEVSDSLLRTSYFDANGELLLEINQYFDEYDSNGIQDIDDEYLQIYEAVHTNDGITIYRDGDDCLGATFVRNNNYYIVRTPMGVSEDALQTIIGQI